MKLSSSCFTLCSKLDKPEAEHTGQHSPLLHTSIAWNEPEFEGQDYKRVWLLSGHLILESCFNIGTYDTENVGRIVVIITIIIEFIEIIIEFIEEFI